MALLIDGYNLLHVTDIFGAAGPGTDLHRSRVALLSYLAATINDRERSETTIVFDAAGAPPGLPRTMQHEGITVHFARRHSDADEMIEDLVEQCAAPRALVVVSSDHRVQRAARHHGAAYVDSKTWYDQLRSARRGENVSEKQPAKPGAEMSPEELWQLIGEFAVPPTDDDAANPFPPGYAEDLDEDS